MRRPNVQYLIPGAVLTLVLGGAPLIVPSAERAAAQGPASATDSREQVRLGAAEATGVRAEMRQMLASISGVVQGLAQSDLVAVEKAAKASGMAAAVDPHLEKKLPRPFLDLGLRTHRGFDEVAAAAKSGAPAPDLLSRLAGVTSNCVACHAIYRLGDPR
jgi:hypothetical protein